MDYYNKHADEFIKDTLNSDMSDLYRFFEKHLKIHDKILDLGFGSGRDSLYFMKKYEVYALDPEIKFCQSAKKMGIKNILNIKAQDLSYANYFDAIWACASLLHVPSNELNETFLKCSNALKSGGVFYCSFKYGDFEGVRNNRYYLDLKEETLLNYLKDTNLEVVETLITDDVRPNRNDKWLNVILIKRGT